MDKSEESILGELIKDIFSLNFVDIFSTDHNYYLIEY